MLLSRVAVLVLLALLFAAPGHAEEGELERNTVGGFVGYTGDDRRDNGFTLALIYERRFTESFGIGAEIERVFGDLDFWVAAVPFAWHVNQWKFFAGPGIEKPDHGDTEALLRVGGEYAFEFGQWEVAPAVAMDFVDSETEIILGVGLQYRF